MPKVGEHIQLSSSRTGKPFTELHKWIEENHYNPDLKRHDIINIPANIEVVKKKFGKEAVEEFLCHIKEDYEENSVYRLVKVLSKIKQAALSPLRLLSR